MKKITLWAVSSLLILMTNTVAAQNVWTQHNDQGRTGWYPYETTLNTTNVNKNTFGLSFSHQTDDRIFAQPLVVLRVNIPDKGIKNVVYVATLNNTVYAFDADANANAYWVKNFTNKISAAPGTDCTVCRPATSDDMHPSLCNGGYTDISGNIGIVGTPVIDTTAGTMYFVTKIVNPSDGTIDNHAFIDKTKNEYTYTNTGFHQYLHAIDITTGEERPSSPVEITATVPGTGDGKDAGNMITFDPRRQFDRAGLVLSNGVIYLTFAAHCDFNPSHGWVISYDATTLHQIKAYNATPNDGRGGSWMSGSAPAVDGSGNLYLTTGNSLNEFGDANSIPEVNLYPAILPSDPANRGESVIKLTPNLTLASFFTPFTYLELNDADKDFGTQVMLIPGTNLAMTGCKDDSIYVMDQNNLGGFDPVKNHTAQSIFVSPDALMHSSFSYFGGPTPYVYQFSENSRLRAYPVSGGGLNTSGAITNTAIAGPTGYSGAFLAVSSKGSDASTAVLWAYRAIAGCNANGGDCHGILHAVKADNVTTELWNSDMIDADKINIFNKMSCPSVALGKVYLAANKNALLVYGLKTNTSCVVNVALNKPVTASSEAATVEAKLAVDGDMGSRWSSNFSDNQWIAIDLGARYDICKMAIFWETAFGKDFDLQVSEDGSTWTTVDPVRGNSSLATEFNGACSGRYVRMNGIQRGSGFGYSIYEFQVFGNPASSCPTPSGLSASSVSVNTELLSWSPVFGASQYIIKYRPNNSGSWITRTSNTNSITLSALSCGTIYYDSVGAVCPSDNSNFAAGSFQTEDCPANSCDILPTRYDHVDLGDIGVAGSVCKNATVYTISGSASLDGADGLQFVYTGNGILDQEAHGQLILQDQASSSNKLGIMVRDSLTNTSRFAFIASVSNGNKIVFDYRDVPGGPIHEMNLPGQPLPFWLKVGKIGTQYSASTSPDGVNWTLVAGPVQLNFGSDPANPPNYGMAVTSGDNTLLSTGKIDNFDLAGSAPLPIILSSFTAKKVGQDQVLVSWTTSMEEHVDHFDVQRSGSNASFQTIGTVKAVGESETPQSYSLTDEQPMPGINYYRLNEIDKDGRSFISLVVSVKLADAEGVEVYPNPANSYTNIITRKDPILELNLFDATGKSLDHFQYANGRTTVKLNTASLTPGIYFLSIKTKSKTFRQKLSKQ
jgi:hypothetical protein